jgi:alkylation response protein AidB-like acyl-CoA dehydrogenase
MAYQAPVDDILFALKMAADLPGLVASGIYQGVDEETVRAILEEAGKFATEVLDPLNSTGDRVGSRLMNGTVATPPGWSEAYRKFAEAGWSALPCPAEYGGQELPELVSMAACEIWNSANLSFGLCPFLTLGAIDALHAHGSEELKRLYLSHMISGRWTGTMDLTEPQAGSDLGAIKTRAVRHADGTYRVFGTKIFITYGDHDLTENIIHMVLARLPDAPPGTKGISLFLVPKRLVNADGSLGGPNDVVCVGLEHKLGIHASPTAVIQYGEKGGAVGYLVGEEHRGLNTMFIMMNAARLAVGMQGVAVAERATQRAVRYANERRQGRGTLSMTREMVAIIEHPDIRRMLLTMKALTQAARCLCLATAREIDLARRAKSEAERNAAADRVALLTPVAKAFSTDIGCEVASLALQVHGGMGFVEETGAAQHYRDARILPIYEGTNGIQAIDLVLRKLPLGGGSAIASYLAELKATVMDVEASNRPEFGRMGQRMAEALAAFEKATAWMAEALARNPETALAGATPYLRLFGLAAGGHYLARCALAAARDGQGASPRSIALARFFAEHLSVASRGLAAAVTTGADSVLGLTPDQLST